MSKAKKTARRTRRANADKSATTDVVTQLECAIRRPQATLIGALVGGIVPWFARTLAHDQLPAAWSAGNTPLAMVMLAVVLGCAVFSAITVYKFGRATFGCVKKAFGFVAAIEGVMLVSTGVTSHIALLVLILINALANGSAIALAREAACKRREAAARASTTRARRRSQAVTPPVDASSKAFSAKAPRARAEIAHVIDAEVVSEQRVFS